ncbi:MAG: DUF2953 domain-containing protein [Clostridia bacterium]
MNLIIILGILFAILILILCIRVGIGVKYDNGIFMIVKIAVFKYEFKFNRKVKKLSQKNFRDSDAKKTIDKSIVGVDFILDLLGDFRKFVRKRVSLEDFQLNITFGTAEASSTAVSAGALWAISYNLLGLIDKLVLVKKPKVDIKPVFNEATWNMSVSGIVTSRLAHIITVAIVFAIKYFNYKKNKNKSRRTNK